MLFGMTWKHLAHLGVACVAAVVATVQADVGHQVLVGGVSLVAVCTMLSALFQDPPGSKS